MLFILPLLLFWLFLPQHGFVLIEVIVFFLRKTEILEIILSFFCCFLLYFFLICSSFWKFYSVFFTLLRHLQHSDRKVHKELVLTLLLHPVLYALWCNLLQHQIFLSRLKVPDSEDSYIESKGAAWQNRKLC